MKKIPPLFILAGNGPYDNRGCEAIVRGTVKILRHFYDDPSFMCISNFQNDEQFKKQCFEEFDQSITHKKTNRQQKLTDIKWYKNRLLRGIDPKSNIYHYVYKEMFPYIYDSKAVLSIGGDNYSLNYGIPKLFVELDNIILKKRKPLLIWGASVGPFDKNPKYEKYMLGHLQKIPAIFARESVTIEYLEKNNIRNNVFDVADPAFLLDPIDPKIKGNGLRIEEGAIGINLSPLMARYVTNGNSQEWEKIAAEIVSLLSKRTSRTIYLIPHVTSPHSNDYLFLKSVLSLIDNKSNKITLIDSIYDAAETKWIISKMALFAGARTHSTIASISSCVPTLSFAYSIKATGINRDIFGHESYCLNPDHLQPDEVVKKIEAMLEVSDQIKSELKEKVFAMQEKAMNAGKYLCDLLGE